MHGDKVGTVGAHKCMSSVRQHEVHGCACKIDTGERVYQWLMSCSDVCTGIAISVSNGRTH